MGIEKILGGVVVMVIILQLIKILHILIMTQMKRTKTHIVSDVLIIKIKIAQNVILVHSIDMLI